MFLYKNITIENHSSLSDTISLARKKISTDIISSEETYMLSWYQDTKWTKNNFYFSTIAKDSQNKLVAISSCKLMSDKTLKILCHYYVMKSMRHIYPSISQTNFMPHYVKYAEKHCFKGVWFSIHCFDIRRERLKKSVIRTLNGGKVDLKYQPYVNSFKYKGEMIYNNVKQHKFSYEIKTTLKKIKLISNNLDLT